MLQQIQTLFYRRRLALAKRLLLSQRGLFIPGMVLMTVLALILVSSVSSQKPFRQKLVDLVAQYRQSQSVWPKAELDPSIGLRPLAALTIRERPATGSLEELRFNLGEQLFKDPILSASGQISCESCHNRRLGWGDHLPVSNGHQRQKGRRNAPAIFNAAYQPVLFWDGRAGTLEEQAAGPIQDPVEMNADIEVILQRLNSHTDYPKSFARVYEVTEITTVELMNALATFEHHLERETRFDRFLSGDRQALSKRQIWGLHLFRTKAKCMNCHSGPLLSDGKFHNIGLTYYGRKYEDLGRHNISGEVADVGRFRTPSLRHLQRTGPYMHNGLFPTLRGIVNMYDVGGPRPKRKARHKNNPLFPTTSHLLKPLELTRQEKAALISFLRAL